MSSELQPPSAAGPAPVRAAAPVSAPSLRSGSSRFAAAWWRLHSFCALYSGGFLAFVLVTGAVAMFAPPLYEWEVRPLARLPAPAAFDPAIVPAAVEQGRRHLERDGGRVDFSQAWLPASSTHALRLVYWIETGNENAFRPPAPWYAASVFVHPATGEILGVNRDDRSFAEYLATLHIRIFAGTPGRNFVGLFGLSLLVLSASGLLILGRFLGRKSLWLIRRGPARATNSDLHKLLGFLLVPPALLFAITGFWLGLQGRLMTWFDLERPESFARPAVVEADVDASLPIDLPAALAAARLHHPKLIPETVSWSVEGERTVRIYGRVEPMIYERQSHGVVLDKSDLTVLHRNDAAGGGWREKLFYLQEGLHFGEWGGMTVRWLYFILGLLLAALPFTGYAIQRLRTRRSLRPLVGWTLAACAGSAVLLVLTRTLGYAAANAYGTVLLWTFTAGILAHWILRGWRKRQA